MLHVSNQIQGLLHMQTQLHFHCNNNKLITNQLQTMLSSIEGKNTTHFFCGFQATIVEFMVIIPPMNLSQEIVYL